MNFLSSFLFSFLFFPYYFYLLSLYPQVTNRGILVFDLYQSQSYFVTINTLSNHWEKGPKIHCSRVRVRKRVRLVPIIPQTLFPFSLIQIPDLTLKNQRKWWTFIWVHHKPSFFFSRNSPQTSRNPEQQSRIISFHPYTSCFILGSRTTQTIPNRKSNPNQTGSKLQRTRSELNRPDSRERKRNAHIKEEQGQVTPPYIIYIYIQSLVRG